MDEGEKLQVHYDASDENGINSARIVFRNETGLEIYGYDYDDDGIITVGRLVILGPKLCLSLMVCIHSIGFELK